MHAALDMRTCELVGSSPDPIRIIKKRPDIILESLQLFKKGAVACTAHYHSTLNANTTYTLQLQRVFFPQELT
jgi:hypothetical protein